MGVVRDLFPGGAATIDWSGPGRYRLHAHVLAGDLYLYQRPGIK